MGYDFRRARPDDAEALRRFKCANPGEKWTRTLQQTIRREVSDLLATWEDGAGIDVLVATYDTAVIGVVVCVPTPHDEVRMIEVLAVAHAHRRKKVGTRLKFEVLGLAVERECTEVISQVHRRNTPMRNLNARLGVVADQDPADRDYLLSVASIVPDSVLHRVLRLIPGLGS